jgi:Probable sensor domain DACNV
MATGNTIRMNDDFPPALANLIVENWNTSPTLPGYLPGPCSSESVLVALLNACFFASLKREEGRSIQFDLALCCPSDLPEAAFRYSRFTRLFNLIRFSEPRRLSVQELVRLAPACNPEKTILLAGCDANSRELDLLGIVDLGSQPCVSHASLTGLRIRVFGPGDMRVMLHGDILCAYDAGVISYPERSLITSGCIYDFFRETSQALCRDVMTETNSTMLDYIDKWLPIRPLRMSLIE